MCLKYSGFWGWTQDRMQPLLVKLVPEATPMLIVLEELGVWLEEVVGRE